MFCSGERLNISSALIKQCITLCDFETWSQIRKEYLPAEYHTLYEHIQKEYEGAHEFPTFEALEYGIRHAPTKEKVAAIQSLEVDLSPHLLLEYLKNEYTQKELFSSIDNYLDETILFSSAQESIDGLQQIVLDITDKVDLELPQDSMRKISLLPPEEEIAKQLGLGLNTDYDSNFKFGPKDLVLIGGKRGDGKSIACANIANNVYGSGRSAIYFTIEMEKLSILQRCCAIATGVPVQRLQNVTLSNVEWEKVAKWQSERFDGGEERFAEYLEHRDYAEFHKKLTDKHELLVDKQLHIHYDAGLTLAKIRAELDKTVPHINTGVIIVDYINQVKRSNYPNRNGQYDWTEQIEVSKALKTMAQEYGCTVVSPYQIDATGEARFAKGILDAADAAYTIDNHKKQGECISFNCTKMRSAKQEGFTSTMDWESLKIGPGSALTPEEAESESDDELTLSQKII